MYIADSFDVSDIGTGAVACGPYKSMTNRWGYNKRLFSSVSIHYHLSSSFIASALLRKNGYKYDQPVCLTGGLSVGYKPFFQHIQRNIIEAHGTALEGSIELVRAFYREVHN